MSTVALRKSFESALRTSLEGAGLRRSRDRFLWSPCDGVEAQLIVGTSATYGRLTSLVNLAIRSSPFEDELQRVIGGDLFATLASETIFMSVKALNGPPRPKDTRWQTIWPPERMLLEVATEADIAPVVDVIQTVLTTFVTDYVAGLCSLSDVASEGFRMIPERQPLALHLQGQMDAARDAVELLASRPSTAAVAASYASNLIG